MRIRGVDCAELRIEDLTEQLEFARLSRPLFNVDAKEVVRDTRSSAAEAGRAVRILEDTRRTFPDPARSRQDQTELLFILRNALARRCAGIASRSESSRRQRPHGRDRERRRASPGRIQRFLSLRHDQGGRERARFAMAHQIVKEHGGEIRVRTGDPWSVVFTVSFGANQDRRKVIKTRRHRPGASRDHADEGDA
jgi:hypothetical protein